MVSTVLTWEWKTEPVSPLHLYEDTELFDDSTTTSNDLTAFELESSIIKNEDSKESSNSSLSSLNEEITEGNTAEIFSFKLLDDLEDFDQLEDIIKEESFSTWFENKSNIFENVPISIQPRYKTEPEPANIYPLLSQPPQPVQPQLMVQDTTTLIQEFETVFDAVELTHNTLTPPQSPPSVDQNNKTYITIPSINQPTVQPINYIPSSVYYQPVGTPQPDVAHELAVVDELVRSRAENLVDAYDSQVSSCSPSSPSACSSSGNSEYSSDPEWIPEPVQSSEYVVKCTRGRKRSSKPYSRGTEDKKSRKKEQNKNAATRYRQKKKAEIEEILSEEKGLLDDHDKLDNQVVDLQREIKYLKGLMRDLFKAKGLIK